VQNQVDAGDKLNTRSWLAVSTSSLSVCGDTGSGLRRANDNRHSVSQPGPQFELMPPTGPGTRVINAVWVLAVTGSIQLRTLLCHRRGLAYPGIVARSATKCVSKGKGGKVRDKLTRSRS